MAYVVSVTLYNILVPLVCRLTMYFLLNIFPGKLLHADD